jgi:hypothetical protein
LIPDNIPCIEDKVIPFQVEGEQQDFDYRSAFEPLGSLLQHAGSINKVHEVFSPVIDSHKHVYLF